jgi:hypothetical protein
MHLTAALLIAASIILVRITPSIILYFHFTDLTSTIPDYNPRAQGGEAKPTKSSANITHYSDAACGTVKNVEEVKDVGRCGKNGPPYRFATCNSDFFNATWFQDASCTGAVNYTEQYTLNTCNADGKKDGVEVVCFA